MRIEAAASSQLEDDQPTAVEIQGRRVLLVRSGGRVFAMDDQCPHASQSMATSPVKEAKVTCKHHGVQIDLASGKVLWSMGFKDLPSAEVFPAEEVDGKVWVELPG